MISKSEKLLTDELIKASSWEYCLHLSTLFQSMLLMVSSFTFLMLYQSEYLPDTLPALLIIWAFWKSLNPKILYSTKSLTFECFWLLWKQPSFWVEVPWSVFCWMSIMSVASSEFEMFSFLSDSPSIGHITSLLGQGRHYAFLLNRYSRGFLQQWYIS